MKKKILERYILTTAVLACAVVFVAKFGGPSLLRLYVESGIGNCQNNPILCAIPEKEIINPEIRKEYLAQMVYYDFPGMGIYLPKGFTVVKEKISRVYYKKKKRPHLEPVIYLLEEEAGFFVNLFPRAKKEGIKNDYEFISRVMYADIKNIKNLTDAFFVIMKSVFTPDLGGQKNIKMVKFTLGNAKGFINYNISNKENYFDGNIIDRQGNFFKIYIKDRRAILDLDKVLAIISTIHFT